jgi:hypothetical protein
MGFIRIVYYTYFGVKLGDQDKSWASHKVCYGCVEDLMKWSKGKNKAFRFGVPMIRREPKHHSDGPNLPSALCPVHSPEAPIHQPT